MTRLALFLLLLSARPASAQWLPDARYWWNPSFTLLQQHPIAHPLGGAALDLAGRYLQGSGRHAVKRCIAVGIVQSWWELVQVENWRGRGGYSYTYAAWDVAFSEAGCWLTEGLIHGVMHQ